MNEREELEALRRLSALEARDKPESSTVDVVRNALYKGAAGVPDTLLNAPNRIVNLGKAAFGASSFPDVLSGVTGKPKSTFMPDASTPDPDFVRRGLEKVGVINQVQPQTDTQRIIDVLTQGGISGALTGGAGLSKTLTGAGMGALSAGSAAGVQEATGSPGAGMVAGLLAPAAAGTARPALRGSAEWLMGNTLKPSKADWKSGSGDRAIATLLDEGINATSGGVRKLNDRVSDVNDAISSAIANSPATINKNAVADRLRGTRNQFESQVNPTTDVAAIENAWTEFLRHPQIPGATIPVQQAQELKRGTYRQLDKKYGELGSADVEAQKALARGLKEEIANAVPEVSSLNSRESALLNARNVAENRVMVDRNKNPLGLAPLSHSPMGAAAFLADRSALIKSLMARLLNTGSKVSPPKADMGRVTIPLSNEMSDQRRRALAEELRQ